MRGDTCLPKQIERIERKTSVQFVQFSLVLLGNISSIGFFLNIACAWGSTLKTHLVFSLNIEGTHYYFLLLLFFVESGLEWISNKHFRNFVGLRHKASFICFFPHLHAVKKKKESGTFSRNNGLVVVQGFLKNIPKNIRKRY